VGFLIAAMIKAKAAQEQLWDNAQPAGRAGRWMESLSAILMSWLSIEGMINDAVFSVFGQEQAGRWPLHFSLHEKLESWCRRKARR